MRLLKRALHPNAKSCLGYLFDLVCVGLTVLGLFKEQYMNMLKPENQKVGQGLTRSAAVALAVVLGLCVTQAHAGFIVEQDNGQIIKPMAPNTMSSNLRVLSAAPANMNYSNLVQRGYAPTNIDTVSADAKSEKLIDCLHKILPGQWRAYSHIPKDLMFYKAGFKGNNRAWPAVLDEVLKSRRLAAVIDWDRSEITFVKNVKEADAIK